MSWDPWSYPFFQGRSRRYQARCACLDADKPRPPESPWGRYGPCGSPSPRRRASSPAEVMSPWKREHPGPPFQVTGHGAVPAAGRGSSWPWSSQGSPAGYPVSGPAGHPVGPGALGRAEPSVPLASAEGSGGSPGRRGRAAQGPERTSAGPSVTDPSSWAGSLITPFQRLTAALKRTVLRCLAHSDMGNRPHCSLRTFPSQPSILFCFLKLSCYAENFFL